ncbi:DUF4760 domain-containing protein [Clostridium massiliodielmoense]|uniref:DUF4760 domain-containing protein n=1 Tax=Clostridium massiliodielmoense TaxID=1776385 RepID=UPI000A26FDC2|nr:DUF4760 domain-containing protein [Clostridium massiliodielmoense]
MNIDFWVKIATIGSAIFVGYQAKMLKTDYKIKNQRAEIEKAIELSKFYHENILRDKADYIYKVFNYIGIEDHIKHLKYTDLKKFNKKELYQVLGKKTLEDIHSKLKKVDAKILSKCGYKFYMYSMDEYLNSIRVINGISEINRGEKEAIATLDENCNISYIHRHQYDYYDHKYKNEFNIVVCEILNQLEYFAMNFNSNIADERTVYQSLHQTFLGLVKLLYFRISEVNNSGKDKYYTNIIDLFNKWADRYNKQQQQEARLEQAVTYKNEGLKR